MDHHEWTPDEAKAELVFVYGSLRIGASENPRMAGAEWLGRGLARGRLYKVLWQPGLVLDEDGPEVLGDVYKVNAELLREIDDREGVPAGATHGEEYERRKIRVLRKAEVEATWAEIPAEVETWAWIWRKPVDDLEEIPSGDWLDVERPRQPSWFTGLGCLGLLAIPIGGFAGLKALEGISVVIDGDMAVFILFLIAGLGGFGAGIFALRRRERGGFLQVLALTGGLLWLVIAILALGDWVF